MPLIISFFLLLFLSLNALAQSESGVILLYHHVDDDTPPSTTISPNEFRGHLEYLRNNNFNVMPLDEMLDKLSSQQAIAEKAVAISFDDGYESIYQIAFPLLQEFNFPFTVFVSTGPIDRQQGNYMNWAEIAEMSSAGVTIANHMVEHPYMLERMENETQQQWLNRLREEILEAQASIKQYTGQDHKLLAYPYGEYDPQIKQLVASLGFIGLAQNSGAVGFNTDFLAVPRYPLAGIYANLNTARTKFATKAFHVDLLEPQSPVTDQTQPSATLKFAPGSYELEQINCFSNSQAMNIEWVDKDQGILRIIPAQQLTGRRWRYICTAPDTQSNGFYWYSVQWINPEN